MATEKAKRFLWGNPSLDQRWTDVRLALAVLIVQVGAMLLIALHGDHPHRKDLDAIGVIFLVGGPLLLIWRRQAPRAVLSATLVLTGSYYLLGYPYGPAFISLVVAYFTAITRGHHVFAYGSAVCGLIAFIALDRLAGWGADLTVSDYFGVSAWLIVVLIGSEAVRWRRERMQEQRRAHSEEQRRKVGEDRARMAQELHDVLGHNISLINVRAGVALHLIDDKPEEARAALEAIKEASKDALSELRAVLGLLHREGEAAPRAPAPGIAQLDQLVSDARASGLSVEISSAGDPRTLAPAVDPRGMGRREPCPHRRACISHVCIHCPWHR
jgi:signal transduction histidine kinase